MRAEGFPLNHLKLISRQQMQINTTEQMYVKILCRWLQLAFLHHPQTVEQMCRLK